MGALSPKQQDFRRSMSLRPAKGGPKRPKTSATLWALYGETASPKKEGEIHIYCPPHSHKLQEVGESQAPLI